MLEIFTFACGCIIGYVTREYLVCKELDNLRREFVEEFYTPNNSIADEEGVLIMKNNNYIK